MAARNEVLAVQVERDRVELDRLRAEAAADAAEANLQRLLDLPATARVEPAEPLAAAAPAGADVEALVAEAQAGRAERKALAARANAAGALAGAERGARLPQVAVSGGYTYANPNRDIVPPTSRVEGHLGRRRRRELERLRRRPPIRERGAGPRAGRRGAPRSCASSTARSASR